MQTIGERLEEARKRKGISIREASEATKIRGDYLGKFEGNNFDINLPDIYVRGFLRTYGTFLKLNTDKLLTDLSALGIGRGREARRDRDVREFLGRIDLPEATTANVPADDEQARRDAAQAPRTAPPPRASSGPATLGGGGGDNRNLVKIALIGGLAALAVVVLVLVIKLLSGDSPSPSAPPRPTTPAQTTPATPTEADALSNVITLIALDTVRVKVSERSDGTMLFDGTLVRGERRAIARRGAVTISYDVGRNLQVQKGSNPKDLYNMKHDAAGRSWID